MKIYIASRFTPNRKVVLEMSKKLTNIGIECVQTWPLESADCSRIDAAKRDLREIKSADTLVLYTHGCETVPGGMHFEAGYAVAKRKKFVVIGPRVHIFCDLADEFYETFEDYFLHMDALTYDTREGGRWTVL